VRPTLRSLPSFAPIVGASLVLRLVIAGTTGFGVDEAYAVTVSRPFSLSYFDHPPLHFWIAGAAAQLAHDTSPFWIRLPFVLLFTVTLVAIGNLTERLFSVRAAVFAVASLALSGVLGVTTGTWVLPDGPLVAATSVTAWLLAPLLVPSAPASGHEAVHVVSARIEWRWILIGVGTALAVLSKYHAVLTAGGVVLYFATVPASRWWLRTPWPWIAAAIGAIGMVPIIWWNAGHDWASFAFQGARASASHWSIAPVAENLAGQAAWLLPWIGIPLAIALVRALRAGPSHHAQWFCVCLAAGPIVMFTAIALGGARGLPHWQAPGWLFVFPLLGAWVDDVLRRGITWPRRWLAWSAIATMTLVCALLLHVRVRAFDHLLSASARRADPSLDAVSWRPVVEAAIAAAERERVSGDGEPLVLAARSWIQAGQIGASLGRHAIPVVCLCRDPHHFAWQNDTLPTRWTRVVLLDRLQPERRGWRDAEQVLGSDSVQISARDTVTITADLRVARYVIRRAPPRRAPGRMTEPAGEN